MHDTFSLGVAGGIKRMEWSGRNVDSKPVVEECIQTEAAKRRGRQIAGNKKAPGRVLAAHQQSRRDQTDPKPSIANDRHTRPALARWRLISISSGIRSMTVSGCVKRARIVQGVGWGVNGGRPLVSWSDATRRGCAVRHEKGFVSGKLCSTCFRPCRGYGTGPRKRILQMMTSGACSAG